jgi:membrane-associated phospholipid phosphatase
MEFGYFTFFPLYPAVAGVLWARRRHPRVEGAFRHLTDSLSVGYLICYTTYLLFPTLSPAHHAGIDSTTWSQSGGPFHLLVRLVQGHAGVHGNAFPSAHIMLASVVMVFSFRYLPRLAPGLLFCVVLMGFGAVYDGYHYALDVFAGGLLGIVVGAAFVGKHPVVSNK